MREGEEEGEDGPFWTRMRAAEVFGLDLAAASSDLRMLQICEEGRQGQLERASAEGGRDGPSSSWARGVEGEVEVSEEWRVEEGS